MSRREKVHSLRLTDKNKVYLKTLGFLDARNWSVRKDGPDFSRFVNECITYVLETGKSGYSLNANPAELSMSYYDHELLRLKRENDVILKEMERVRKSLYEAEDEHLKLKQRKALQELQ